jgi:tryptophanyl-tRNA synthetase
LLLQSQAFAQGREAGEWVKRFKQDGARALSDAPVSLVDGVSRAAVEAALAALVAAQE